MKKTIITIIAITCMISLTSISSHAGSSKRARLEGFIIGSSTAFLGAAIINQLHHNRPRVIIHESKPRHHKKHYRSNRHRHNDRRRYHEPRGHWEVERIWVAEEYEERWNPGHYNKKGVWKSGRYQRFVVREGYWTEKRVWVSRY